MYKWVGECESLELKEVSGTRHTYLQVTSMSRKPKVMEIDTLREGVKTKTQRGAESTSEKSATGVKVKKPLER